MISFEKLSKFFETHPAISLPDFSREMGRGRNYMEQLLKSGKLSEKQAQYIQPFVEKYGYTDNCPLLTVY